MTRAFPRYLWKEWRDHRVVLAGIAIAVPALLVLARVLLPQKFVDDPILSQIGAWGSLAIATLALATDLVPGEARRGRLAFLARMPDGLRLAFRAKMAFLVLALAAAPVYGFVCGACLGGWHADGLEFVAGYALLLLCAAPWIFAISCWLPRGALALPATALVLALAALPFYLLHLAFPGYRPLVDDAIGAAVFLAAGALFVAWFSFTRGYRHGGTFLSAGWRGLAASAVLLLPAYAYGGYRVHEWTAVDPAAPEFFIKQVQAGEGDRYLFVNATMKLRGGRQKAHHALVVDAKDGSWRRAGVAFGTFEHGVAAARVVPLHDPASATRDERNPEWTKTWTHWYDGATGERFKSAWSNARPEEVDAVAFAHRAPRPRVARLHRKRLEDRGSRSQPHVRVRPIPDGRPAGLDPPARRRDGASRSRHRRGEPARDPRQADRRPARRPCRRVRAAGRPPP